MISIAIGCIMFACCFDGALFGMFLRARLPKQHLGVGRRGNYSHSGSTTAIGRYGSTYLGCDSGSGSSWLRRRRLRGAYRLGGYSAYHYGGCCGGGGFQSAAVSGPYGTAYAAGVHRHAW